MIGPRVGVVVGPRVGVAIGVSANELAAESGGGGIPGVTRDAGNSNYYPANAGEWTAFMAAAGLATGNPSSVWNCQEASGNLADAIGAVSLTPAVAGHLYQQAVTGAARVGVKGVGGTSNQRWDNTATAPNANLTSVGLLMFLSIPAAPGTISGVGKIVGTEADGTLRWATTGQLRLLSGGAAANLINSCASRRMWVYFQHNRTAGTVKVFTDQEKFSGAYTLPASGVNMLLGGSGGAAGPISDIVYAYAAEFTGAAAEHSDAQVKTLLQTLGATIPWT